MNDFINKKDVSEILLHQFIKCIHLMRGTLHRGREAGFGHHSHFGPHHMHHGAMEGRARGGGRGPDMIKIGQGRLLSFLLEKDGINQKELSELLRISPASVSELINKLESGGYIERKQNELDKRVSNIFLTDGGRFFAQKMEEERLEVAKDIFVALDEGEQKQLLILIEKIIKSLSNDAEDKRFKDPAFCFRGNHFMEEQE